MISSAFSVMRTVNEWPVRLVKPALALAAVVLSLLTMLGNPAEAETTHYQRVEVAPPVSKTATAEPPQQKKRMEAALMARIQVRWTQFRKAFRRSPHPCTGQRPLFEEASAASGVPAAVIAGVTMQESGRCRNVPGGWMQITTVNEAPLRRAARALNLPWLRFDPRGTPREAVMAGAMVLRDLWDRYGKGTAAILAYNLGPSGLADRGGIEEGYARLRPSLPPRVRDYLPNVLAGTMWSAEVWEGEVPAQAPRARTLEWLAMLAG